MRGACVAVMAVVAAMGGYASGRRAVVPRMADGSHATNLELQPNLAPVVPARRDEPAPVRPDASLDALEEELPEDPYAIAEAVVPLATHTDPDVRCRALALLAEAADEPGVIDVLVRALSDPEADVRAAAADALADGAVDAPEAAAALAARVTDGNEDEEVRERAWGALAEMETTGWPARVVEQYRAHFEEE